MDREIRAFNFEVRAKRDETHGDYIEGRAIVFGAPTDMGYYTEIIDDGALDATDLRDVRLLVNHNTSMIPLARSRNNNANSTMQLSVVPGGGMDIRANMDTENNSDAKSLYSACGRGDISGMSFMFSVDIDSWENLDSDHPTRHIRSISRVFEVSAVTFPAYEQTTLEARGLADALDSAKASLDSARAQMAAQRRESDLALLNLMLEVQHMRIDEIEARKAEIAAMSEDERRSNAAELLAEVRALNAEAAAIRDQAAHEEELRTAVAPETVSEIRSNKNQEVRTNMETVEIRNSADYINAYANYIKTGKDAECRALLSENVSSGSVPVPSFVEDMIRHAWDDETVMARVRKTFVPGNLKIGFEKAAGSAVVHTEGAAAPAQETLELGTVTLTPASYKKWITVSDEALDLGGEAFLRYVVEELSYQIAKKAADDLLAKIVAAPAASTKTAAAVASLTATAISTTTIAEAIGHLSDEARNPVVIINKATYAAFKAVQYAAGYAVDVFEGCPVLFNNSLKAFDAAASGNTYAIVGDLGDGAQANFPNGAEINVKIDDLSLAEQDLVKLVGREFAGIGVVAPFRFCKIVK